jgi:hypothetical protein
MLVVPCTLNGTPGDQHDLVVIVRQTRRAGGTGGRHHGPLEPVDLAMDQMTRDAPGQAQPPRGAFERRQREDRHLRAFARGSSAVVPDWVKQQIALISVETAISRAAETMPSATVRRWKMRLFSMTRR